MLLFSIVSAVNKLLIDRIQKDIIAEYSGFIKYFLSKLD